MHPLAQLLMLVNAGRALARLSGPDACPEVRTAKRLTYSTPWRGSMPTPDDLDEWYEEADHQIDRLPQFNVPSAQQVTLRQQFEDLPNRPLAYNPFGIGDNIRRAADIAQAALCLIHEAIGAQAPSPEPQPPQPTPEPEDDGPSLPDFPSIPGMDWPGLPSWPGLPELPSIPPWVFAAGGALLLLWLFGGNEER
jgi:hypothetical protein